MDALGPDFEFGLDVGTAPRLFEWEAVPTAPQVAAGACAVGSLSGLADVIDDVLDDFTFDTGLATMELDGLDGLDEAERHPTLVPSSPVQTVPLSPGTESELELLGSSLTEFSDELGLDDLYAQGLPQATLDLDCDVAAFTHDCWLEGALKAQAQSEQRKASFREASFREASFVPSI